MTISAFELFTIGLGPSSSHTVGPMRAARMFAECLERESLLPACERITCQLYGSLGATGKGHGTDRAVVVGLIGVKPEEATPEQVEELCQTLASSQQLELLGKRKLYFSLEQDMLFERKTLGAHSNTLVFSAFNAKGEPLLQRRYYSVGGGFVVQAEANEETHPAVETSPVPHPFTSAAELLTLCQAQSLPISGVMLENEKTWRSEEQICAGLLQIWQVMQNCVEQGCRQEGVLPGGLKVKRRAPGLTRKLQTDTADEHPLNPLSWVNVWAIAVSEENPNRHGRREMQAAELLPPPPTALRESFPPCCTTAMSSARKG